jgi:3-deoxy-D-manno-octulosonic-acid transferase
VCSFGEAVSIKPLIERVEGVKNISTITNTGYELSKRYEADVRFLPYEFWLWFWIKKMRVLVVSEAELWYLLFYIAKRKGAKTILINARISDNSYESYLRFKWFYKRIFQNIDKVFAQTDIDRDRLLELGAKSVEVVGNIKAYERAVAKRGFKKPNSRVITLASTHKDEEKMLLERLKIGDNDKVVVVPRHPERFDEVGRFLEGFAKERGFTFHKFSQREDFESDIVLVDTLGMLVDIYSISDIVLLGGSFVPDVGGHNPLEPANFRCKIVSGREFFNQRKLYELVDNIEVTDVEGLNEAIERAKRSDINSSCDIEPIIREIEDVV